MRPDTKLAPAPLVLRVRLVTARLKRRFKSVQVHFAAFFFVHEPLARLHPLQLLSRHVCRQGPRLFGALCPRVAITQHT